MSYLIGSFLLVLGVIFLWIVKRVLKIDSGSVQTAAILSPSLIWLIASGALSEFTAGDISVKIAHFGAKEIGTITQSQKLTDVIISEESYKDLPFEDLPEQQDFLSFKVASNGSIDLWVYLDDTKERNKLYKWLNTLVTSGWLLGSDPATFGSSISWRYAKSNDERNPLAKSNIRFLIFGYRNGAVEFYLPYSTIFTSSPQRRDASGLKHFTTLPDSDVLKLSNAVLDDRLADAKTLPISVVPVPEDQTTVTTLETMDKLGLDIVLVTDKRRKFVGTIERRNVVAALLTVVAKSNDTN